MRTRIITFVAICGIVATVGAVGTEDDATGGSTELEALKTRVQALEHRVLTLERRLGQAPRREIIPMPRLPERQVPEGWLPRGFDGVRFYVIPLANDGEDTAGPAR